MCKSDYRSTLSVDVPIPMHAMCVYKVSHAYATAGSVHNQENAQNSSDPFPRERWGLETRLSAQLWLCGKVVYKGQVVSLTHKSHKMCGVNRFVDWAGYAQSTAVESTNLVTFTLYYLCTVRLIDPTNDEPRLLKLKDWPTGDDFSEKLPRRYVNFNTAAHTHTLACFLYIIIAYLLTDHSTGMKISLTLCLCLNTQEEMANSIWPPAYQASLSSLTWDQRCTMLTVSLFISPHICHILIFVCVCRFSFLP